MMRFACVAALIAVMAFSGAVAETSLPPAATTMPSPDRLWSPDDFETVAGAFADLPPTQLPASNGPNASPLFRRLVDPANLQWLQNTETPLDGRIDGWGRVMFATTRILMRYLPLMASEPTRSDDLLWLEGLMIEEAAAAVGMLDELKAGKGANSPDVQQALTKITDGIQQMVDGTIETLRNVPQRPGDARGHLASVLAREYPHLSGYLNESARQKTETALAGLARDDRDPAVQAALKSFASKK